MHMIPPDSPERPRRMGAPLPRTAYRMDNGAGNPPEVALGFTHRKAARHRARADDPGGPHRRPPAPGAGILRCARLAVGQGQPARYRDAFDGLVVARFGPGKSPPKPKSSHTRLDSHGTTATSAGVTPLAGPGLREHVTRFRAVRGFSEMPTLRPEPEASIACTDIAAGTIATIETNSAPCRLHRQGPERTARADFNSSL